MADCSHDCGTCGKTCEERDMTCHLRSGSSVKKVIGIVSGKGGVGKSLVTSFLACKISRDGYKTAILDADITGPSIPESFGIGLKRAEGDGESLNPVVSEKGIQIMSMNFLLENENTSCDDHKTEKNDSRIAVLKLRHIPKIHTIPACN